MPGVMPGPGKMTGKTRPNVASAGAAKGGSLKSALRQAAASQEIQAGPSVSKIPVKRGARQGRKGRAPRIANPGAMPRTRPGNATGGTSQY